MSVKEEQFFKKRKRKCDSCLLKQKLKRGDFKLSHESDLTFIKQEEGEKDILIIVEQPHKVDPLLRDQIQKFHNFIKRMIPGRNTNYMLGLQCECAQRIDVETEEISYPIPSPYYKVYRSCNMVSSDVLNQYKVVITLGRALYAVTQNDDIQSWEEFSEFQFNPTYILSPEVGSQERVRVYPFPSLMDFLSKSNFENFFVKKQCEFIRSYLTSFKEEYINSYEMLHVEDPNSFLREKIHHPMFSFDLETSGLNMFAPGFEIICITISFDGKTGYYLPFDRIDKQLLNEFFVGKMTITANGKYDSKCLEIHGVKAQVDEDVILLFHMLSTERIKNGLKTLAWFIGFGGYEKDLDSFLEQYHIDDFRKIPMGVLFPYAVKDALVTFRIYEIAQELLLKQPNLREAYRIIMQSIPVFQRMEMSGVLIDQVYLNKMDARLKKKEDIVARNIQRLLGTKFDVASNKQLAEILQKKKWKNHGKTKGGYLKTGDTELSLWAKDKKSARIAKKLIKFRKTSKLRSAFIGSTETHGDEDSIFQEEEDKIEGLAKYIQKDSRIHASYSPGMADSLRSRCSSPNAQQYPQQGIEGKWFKPVLIAPDGFVKGKCDFSGFQIRIAGIFSGDENLIQVHTNPDLAGKDLRKADVHSMTAVTVFRPDMSVEEFMKVKGQLPYSYERYSAKTIVFSFLFGTSARTFSISLQEIWTEKVLQEYLKRNNLESQEDSWVTAATDIRSKFFNGYPRLEKWIENTKMEGKFHGYRDGEWGARRHVSYCLINGDNTDRKKYSNYSNICTNSTVQSFEALHVYRSMTRIQGELDRRNMKTAITGMVHDSLDFYVHRDEVGLLEPLLRECCEDHHTYSIPLLIDVDIEGAKKK